MIYKTLAIFLPPISNKMDKHNIEQIIDNLNDQKLIDKALAWYNHLLFKPIFGYEMEFYLPDDNIEKIENALNIKLEKERGLNQYELQQGPFDDASKTCQSILQTRQQLLALGANLAPKPFPNDYGSSMHIHLNILMSDGSNIFQDKKILQFAACGMCYFMSQTLFAILRLPEEYRRLDMKFMAPTHICYGNNNRTVAIRVPQAKPIRIEHRLCSNYSNPYKALFILLKSSMLGIENRFEQYSQIFGNAFDNQYNLEALPLNTTQAQKLFNINFFLE